MEDLLTYHLWNLVKLETRSLMKLFFVIQIPHLSAPPKAQMEVRDIRCTVNAKVIILLLRLPESGFVVLFPMLQSGFFLFEINGAFVFF